MTTNANGMQKETLAAINAWSITELATHDPFVLKEMQDAITETRGITWNESADGGPTHWRHFLQ